MSSQIDITTKLGDLIHPNSKSVWKMGTRMRMRPELIFQILSDAFDTALEKGTLRIDGETVGFETDFAGIELIPTTNPLELYKYVMEFIPKDAMLTIPVTAHPKEAFSVPDRMENNIFVSNVAIHRMGELLGLKRFQFSSDVLEALALSYRKAKDKGQLLYDGEAVQFDTDLKADNGQKIWCTIEPDLYAPIPNTWKIVDAYCNDGYEIKNGK